MTVPALRASGAALLLHAALTLLVPPNIQCQDLNPAANSSLYPWRWPLYHIPSSSNLPSVSLPDAFGVLDYVESQWYYFAGTLSDETSTNTFSVYCQLILGFVCNTDNQVTSSILTIAHAEANTFVAATGHGQGITTNQPDQAAGAYVSVPTADSFAFSSQTTIDGSPDNVTIAFSLTGGAKLGDVGATYALLSTSSSAALNLSLVDTRGTIMSGLNGYVYVPANRTGLPIWLVGNCTVTALI